MQPSPAEIAANAYSLPTGLLPVVDGEPRWPWSPEAARERLQRVAVQLGLVLTGTEVLLDGGSNDAWIVGDSAILRICWRGDVDRVLREARLAEVCPVPYPNPLAFGRDADMSWVLSPRVAGRELGDVWAETSEPELRALVRDLAGMMRALNDWRPPEVRTPLAAPAGAMAIAGHTLIPFTLGEQLTLIEYAAGMPYADAGLLGDLAAVLAELHASIDFGADQVFVHGDISPSNVLIDGGRIVAILDHEWAAPGPRDAELLLPSIWVRASDPAHRPQRLLTWLVEDYPELFAAPDLHHRTWVYEAVFAVTGYLRWPLDGPECEAENGCQRRLRAMLGDL